MVCWWGAIPSVNGFLAANSDISNMQTSGFEDILPILSSAKRHIRMSTDYFF